MTFDAITIVALAGGLLLAGGLVSGTNSYGVARSAIVAALLLLGFCLVCFASLLGPWGYAGVAALVFAAVSPPVVRRLTVLGSSRFAEPEDIDDLLDADHGLPVGRLITPRPPFGAALRALFNPFTAPEAACRALLNALSLNPRRPVVRLAGGVPHNLVIGPPGSFKTSAIVVQLILALAFGDASFFCVDVKGEIATLCGAFLQEHGYDVHIVDPHHLVTKTPATFDPVRNLVPGSPDVVPESKSISEDIVVTDPHEQQKHWPETAKRNLAAAIAYVVEFGGQHKSLQTGIGTVVNRQYREQMIKVMQAALDKHGGLVSRLADEIANATGDELASILSTLGTELSAFSTPAAAASMASSSFRPQILKERKAAVFFVIPPSALKSERGLLRMWLGSTIRALLKDGLGGRTVHGIIDEAATVGPMDAIDQAIAIGRGYGINIHLFFQSLPQMEVVYPHGQARAVLAQMSQVYLQVQDAITAEHVSKTLGPATVEVESGGTNNGQSFSQPHGTKHNAGSTTFSSGTNDGWSLQSRPLLHPSEVITAIPRGCALTILPGRPAILTELVPWFADANLCAPPPDVAGKALALGLTLLAAAAWAAISVL